MTRIASDEMRPTKVPRAEQDEQTFVPLTAEQARQWRLDHPQLPASAALRVQLLVGVLVTLLTWAVTGQSWPAVSAAYGVLVALVPAMVAAKGMARWAAPGFPVGAALAGFLLWEAVKLILAVGMLLLAPRILGAPNWPALLVGLVLTIKLYWVGVLLLQTKKSR